MKFFSEIKVSVMILLQYPNSFFSYNGRFDQLLGSSKGEHILGGRKGVWYQSSF